jgi:uncharacterized protein
MVKREFFPPQYYGKASSYKLLPFRFIALDSESDLLVNEAGEYVFAPRGAVSTIVRHGLDTDSELYRELRAKQFVCDDASSPLLDVLATKYRTKRSFLDGFTQLHIFVVTLRCEHSCPYCQVSRQCQDKAQYDMSRESAEGFLRLMFRSPAESLTLEFQGGEPLLNFDLIKHIVERAEVLGQEHGKNLRFVIATNLALLSEPVLAYCKEHDIHLSTSLDGPEDLHNLNRPRPGRDSHELVLRNLEWAREYLGLDKVAGLMTTTRHSLARPRDIVDEYVSLGFRSIFLRRLSPYGFAVKTAASIGYELELFLKFYFEAFEYILELNRSGVYLEEAYAKLLLAKILTPFPVGYVDLQSPAGAGIAVAVYNYDGAVYASDEARMLAEMNDDTFLLGNVHQNTYEEIFGGPKLVHMVRESCVEAIPGCSDCALQTYCGSDPVYNYSTQGDLMGHRPTSGFCKANMTILKHLFMLLKSGDRQLNRIFWSWVREVSHEELAELGPGC